MEKEKSPITELDLSELKKQLTKQINFNYDLSYKFREKKNLRASQEYLNKAKLLEIRRAELK